MRWWILVNWLLQRCDEARAVLAEVANRGAEGYSGGGCAWCWAVDPQRYNPGREPHLSECPIGRLVPALARPSIRAEPSTLDPKHAPARLDADRTAVPKTHLVAHAVEGQRISPAIAADTHVDEETGKRMSLGNGERGE